MTSHNLRETMSRMRGVIGGHKNDAELDAELQAHLEMEIDDLVARGMDPAAARRQALINSGGITQAADAIKEQRGMPWIESTLADIRYAFRALRRAPAFSIVVVLTLALGIGANTAIFSVVRGVLLKPLPNRDGSKLIYLRQSGDAPGDENLSFSVPEVRDLRAGAPSLGGLAEFSNWGQTMQLNGDAIHINVALVTGNYFEVMGLQPELGRLTRPTDDGKGVQPVMVLTHDFWMKRFGGDPKIIGKQVTIDGMSVTVIGVVEPAPFYPGKVEALLNLVVSPHHLSAQMVDERSHRMTELVARLAPGATVAQAQGEVRAVYKRMQSQHPEAYNPGSHYRVDIMPFKTVLGEKASMTLWLLMAAAAFVMIISAANVANLTLMRGVRREQELVVRAALGAGVRRLRRLLLVENLMLALIGAALGIGIAVGGVKMLTSLAERYSPRASEIKLDTVVLGYTLGLSVVIALLLSFLGSLPKEGTFASISAGARRITTNMSKRRLQRGLVVAQIAVSVVLLAGAGLLTRTLMRLSEVNTGLETENVLTMPVSLVNPANLSMETDTRDKLRYKQMQSEIAALPGVIDVALGSTMPLTTTGLAFDIKAEGVPPVAAAATPHADYRTASPEYFSAAGITIRKGKSFDGSERMGSPLVVVINETMAKRLFPGQDAVGKRIAWGGELLKFTPVSPEWRTVIGVVGDTRDGGLDVEPRAAVFVPFMQEFTMMGGLVIRAQGDAGALASQATHIVQRIVPGVPVENVKTVTQIKEEYVAPRRLNAVLISSFGILALIIAAVGIGGVLAFSVSARTGEIGIRMSLGANSGNVQRMVLREGGELLALGLVAGVVAAFFGLRVIGGLLFGVTANDPVTFVGVAVLMGFIGAAACWIPALRASRIDPNVAMRA